VCSFHKVSHPPKGQSKDGEQLMNSTTVEIYRSGTQNSSYRTKIMCDWTRRNIWKKNCNRNGFEGSVKIDSKFKSKKSIVMATRDTS
jgi:hypothetical protein